MNLVEYLKNTPLEEIEHNTTVFCVVCIALLVVFALFMMRRHDIKLSHALTAYNAARRSGDRQRALDTGRVYYKLKRRKELTSEDELAIRNDLSVM
jgi:hypothetical protein